MSWFTAKRDGRCSHCKTPFQAGDEIYAKGAGVYLGSGCGCGHLAEDGPLAAGPRESAVLRDLSKLPPEAMDGLIAQNMIGMARQLDEGDVAPREVTNYTKELRLNLLTLQDMFPPAEQDDETEEKRQRRQHRREAGGF